ncbi:MAG: small-conductance mechanosensitive channel [Myxococcota bacterium]|jgi:small-conductance mechanosensitive channel
MSALISWLSAAVWKLDAFLNYELFALQGQSVRVVSVLSLVLVLLLTGLVSRWVRRLLERLAGARSEEDRVALAHTQRMVHYLIALAGLWMALEAVGVRIDALLAAGAVVAVGLGFALQPLAESVVGGVALMMERTIRPGDVLLLDGEPVRVMHMRLRVTIVRDLDGRDTILPNRALSQSRVTLLTFETSRHRLRAKIQLAYNADIPVARAALTEACEALSWSGGDAEVRIVGFADSGVQWEVQVWSSEPWRLEEYRSQLHEAILISMAKHGVIAQPSVIGVRIDGRQNITDLSLSGDSSRS